MSMIVYNGYVINKSLTTYDLCNLMNDINKESQLVFEKLFYNEVSKFASYCLDWSSYYGKDKMIELVKNKYGYEASNTVYNDLEMCIEDLIELHENSNERIKSDFDFRCKFKIHPLKDKLLLRLFTEKEEYKSIFGFIDDNDLEHASKKFPIIEPYVYYNNTDCPKHISCKNWELRKDEWNEALSKNGLEYDLIKIPYTLNYNNIVNCIEQSYESRLRRIAFGIVDRNFSKKMDVKNNISELISKFDKYRKSGKFEEDISKEVDRLRYIIPTTYSLKDVKDISLI